MLISIGIIIASIIISYDVTEEKGTITFYVQNQIKNLGIDSLPQYLLDSGFNVELTNETLTQTSLTNSDCLFIALPTKDLPNNIIWKFVEDGGSLVVVGDHANPTNSTRIMNNLLEPFNIVINHDYAFIDDYYTINHPLTFAFKAYQFQVELGASLNISNNANPLFIAKGDLEDEGQDLIVSATALYGSGKVMVWGDTSMFIDGSLPYTYLFLEHSFQWLTQKDIKDTFSVVYPLIILLMILGFFVTSNFTRSTFFSVIAIILLFYFFLLTPHMQNDLEQSMLIDISHGEKFDLGGVDDTLTSFMSQAMSLGYKPVIYEELSEESIKTCEMVVFNAPTKPFSNSDIAILAEYTKNGGSILLCTGYQDKIASQNLLDFFDLDILPIALGNAPYLNIIEKLNGSSVSFVNVWPIQTNNHDSEIIYQININDREYVVATFVPNGEGGLYLISDSEFILTANDFLPNQALIQQILEGDL